MSESDRSAVVRYHERTKHQYGRFAPSLGYLDWNTQPDPFRRYEGAEVVEMPIPQHDPPASYDDLYRPGAIAARPVDSETVSGFLYYSLALSAWKQHQQSRWALRVNPSSGNLHPIEGYLLCRDLPGTGAGLYHYAPREHALERRAEISDAAWSRLSSAHPDVLFLVGMTAIPWRESWKYGERAYRYCQHDAGHALAALRIAAALYGWRIHHQGGVGDDDLASLLGIEREDARNEHEPELPVLLVTVTGSGSPSSSSISLPRLRADDLTWSGRANVLSPEHHPWPAIDEVARSCRIDGEAFDTDWPSSIHGDAHRCAMAPESAAAAGGIIRQRRSALAMDGQTTLARDVFWRALARTVPSLCPMPWDAIRWPVCAHLAITVHRVTGVTPGLYMLARDPEQIDDLRGAMRREFAWQRVEGCPDALPFRLLAEGDYRATAARVSCEQDIAADGAFSLGMVVRFNEAIEKFGAPFYRHLFWETGMIGQVLYLESEAAGLRSTGIGCFFDDPVHDPLGLTVPRYQSLYHFTVGGPVLDTRLVSEPAYPESR